MVGLMNLAKKLFKLQQIEQDISAGEKALADICYSLADKSVINAAKNKLSTAEEKLGGLAKQQRQTEQELEDVSTKQYAATKDLYSGRIKNPKELSNLQHEVENLKVMAGKLEEKDLGLMEEVEEAQRAADTAAVSLKNVEAEKISSDRRLTKEKAGLEENLADLSKQRQEALTDIDTASAKMYAQLKTSKGKAVAMVEQGSCRACGILLSTAWLQRVRGKELVRCSGCGRILYLAG